MYGEMRREGGRSKGPRPTTIPAYRRVLLPPGEASERGLRPRPNHNGSSRITASGEAQAHCIRWRGIQREQKTPWQVGQRDRLRVSSTRPHWAQA